MIGSKSNNHKKIKRFYTLNSDWNIINEQGLFCELGGGMDAISLSTISSYDILQFSGDICNCTRITDTQSRHKLKKSENLGRCGRENMLRPYLKFGSGFSAMQWRRFPHRASVVCGSEYFWSCLSDYVVQWLLINKLDKYLVIKALKISIDLLATW